MNLEEIVKAITKKKLEENLQEAKRVCNVSKKRDSCAPGILEEMERDWGVENTWMFFHRGTRWSVYSAVREVRRLRIPWDEFTPRLAQVMSDRLAHTPVGGSKEVWPTAIDIRSLKHLTIKDSVPDIAPLTRAEARTWGWDTLDNGMLLMDANRIFTLSPTPRVPCSGPAPLATTCNTNERGDPLTIQNTERGTALITATHRNSKQKLVWTTGEYQGRRKTSIQTFFLEQMREQVNPCI